jgi:prepilin-type N-terminal cleavage/methylation domain-containing protein
MEYRTMFIARTRQRGMTLVEILIATGLGSLVMATVMSFALFSGRSFSMMTNYVRMDMKSRNALDRMSQDIRQVDFLASYSSTSLVFQTTDPIKGNVLPLAFKYDPAKQTLTRTLGTTNTVLLTQCPYYHFDLYQRNPSLTNGGDLVRLISTNQPGLVKAIDLAWVCATGVLGATNNTDNLQSARVVIRK